MRGIVPFSAYVPGNGAKRENGDPLMDLAELANIASALPESSSKDTLDDNACSDPDDECDSDGLEMGEGRKMEHNVCEKRRRNNIKQGFEALQNSIPHATMKLSKMEILRTGIAYVKRLKGEIADLEGEIKMLEEQKTKGEASKTP